MIFMAANAEGETTGIPIPESEHEESGIPEPESETKTTPSGTGFAEPTPEWGPAKALWGWSWQFHYISLSILFALLALYCFICLFRLRRWKMLINRAYFVSLTTLILILCISRILYLTIDPYGSLNILHKIIIYMLDSIGFPCLASSFGILFLALLSTTKMKVLPAYLQKPVPLACIICFHFIFSITTDIVVGLYISARILVVVCQSFFMTWAGFLFIGYLAIFHKLLLAAFERREILRQRSSSMALVRGAKSAGARMRVRVPITLAVKATLSISILGLAMIIIQLYGMTTVYGVYTTQLPGAWEWWAYKYCYRLIEWLLCVQMAYIGTQPLRYEESREDLFKAATEASEKRNKLKELLKAACLPCRAVVYRGSYSISDDIGGETAATESDTQSELPIVVNEEIPKQNFSDQPQMRDSLKASQTNGEVDSLAPSLVSANNTLVVRGGGPFDDCKHGPTESLLVIQDGDVFIPVDNDRFSADTDSMLRSEQGSITAAGGGVVRGGSGVAGGAAVTQKALDSVSRTLSAPHDKSTAEASGGLAMKRVTSPGLGHGRDTSRDQEETTPNSHDKTNGHSDLTTTDQDGGEGGDSTFCGEIKIHVGLKRSDADSVASAEGHVTADDTFYSCDTALEAAADNKRSSPASPVAAALTDNQQRESHEEMTEL